MTTERWQYSGDVNLEHGGAFIDLSTWGDGYCSAVRMTDLDSGSGHTGAVLIEHVVINGTDDSERIRRAMRSCGGCEYHSRPPNMSPENYKQSIRRAIADALMFYGYTDPDDCWDGYRSHHTEILQLEADGPMRFYGWKADKRLHNTDLKDYVESVHLS